MSAPIGRVNDPGIPGGTIKRGDSSVICNGRFVGIHISSLGKIKKRTLYTSSGSYSTNVFASGNPVLRSPGGSTNVRIS